jgi:PAS domain S-box-containing protein
MKTRSYLRYIYAILAVPLIILLRFGLSPLIGPGIPYVTLFPVSVAVALLAGMGPAILTGVLGSLAIDYFFIEPLHAIEFNIPGISRAAIVILTSAFVGYVGDILRTARAKAEQQAIELRENQERLHLAQQAANAGTWEWDIKTNKLNWSPELFRLFGLDSTKENASFDLWRSVLHPEDLKEAEAQIEQAIKHRTPLTNEYRVMLSNGEIRWINALGDTVYDEAGRPRIMSGICLDITERKQAEETLRRNEATLRGILDATKESIWLFSADGFVLTTNETALSRFGKSTEDIIGKNLNEILSPELAQSRLAKLRETVEFAQAVEFEDKRSNFFFHHSFYPVSDADGQVTSVVSFSRDITERKKKEEELRKLNRTLRALSDSSQAMMHAKNESEFLEEACNIIVRDCGHIMAWVGFAEDDEGKTVRPVANAGFEQGYLETLNITWADTERGRGPTGTAIRTGRPSMCRNMPTDPAFEPWRKEALKRGYASSIVLPLISEGKTFGALTIYSREPDPFSDDEVKLLTELADDLSYGIVTIRLRIARDEVEASLRQSETKYRDLVQNANSAIIRWKCDGTIMFFNEYAQRLFGYSADEVIGRNAGILVPKQESTGGDLTGLIQDIVARPESYTNNVNENVCRDGRRVWIAWTNKPIFDENGQVKEILAVGTEITERKRAEEALLASETRYRRLFEAARDGILILNAESGQIVDVNPFIEDILGYSHKEFLNKKLWEIGLFKDVAASKEAFLKLQSRGYVRYENLPLETKDGRHIAVEFVSNVYQVDQHKVIQCNIRDITDRAQAEEALHKAHDELDTRVKERTAELGEMVLELQKQMAQRVRAEEASRSASLYSRGLLEASLDPLVTISPEGKITDINRATELVTGLSREGLIDSDFSDYFTEPKKAKDGYKKVLAEGMLKDYPLTIRHISGHTTDVLYNATLYKNEAGQVQGVFAAARDVTEHNRIEKRERITNVLMELFAQKATRKEYLDSVVRAVRDWSGCQCVGIRLTNSDGLIPYESQIGFTKDFLTSESVLSLKTDTCACMRVISQKSESQDAQVMTSKGSFRCDNTLEFFNSLPEKKKARYRGHCIRHGFASLAVVPIRYREKVLGAIHLADKKENKTAAQTIEFIENMAMLIGEAVHRFDIETELRESEERYRQLVELSPEGIGVEREDKIVFINTAATRLLGAKNSAELIGKSILDFIHPDFRERTHRQLEFLRRKRKPLPLRENVFLRINRTILDVEVAATPLIYENRPAAQIVFRDITERKLAQERIIADQKQLRLLTAELLLTEERERHEIATALHDSLGPILAFSKRELGTLQKSVPADISEVLKTISDNISQAVKQTRTLTFDLSPPTLYTLGFEIAIEELIERFSQEHKLEYSFRNSEEPKPLTTPVKILLYRSIREMLINIAKHAKAKLVKITLARNNSDIQVTIEDDGKGFDASVLTEKPKGLGLFSVRERLKHIGGRFEIESKRGKGTHITLTAPLKIE